VAVGGKGVESEVQRLEAKENPIPKTKGHRLEGSSCSVEKVRSSTPPSL
jgi:hypothetical protein